MPKFPEDVPKAMANKPLERLGFRLVREGPHLAMVRENPDGTQTSLTMPNHLYIKGSTLRTICTHAGIAQDEFLKAYEETCVGTRCPCEYKASFAAPASPP